MVFKLFWINHFMYRPLVLLLLAIVGCSGVVKPGSTPDFFPKVQGQALSGAELKIPEDLQGNCAVLLIGYKQKTQFDIDRWILGLLQLKTPIELLELPTIAGMMPEMVSEFISNGMRSGIPQEDWGTVVTVFEDAEKIIAALGNERPQSAYVVLINGDGGILWFYNQGYSAQQVIKLDKLVKEQCLKGPE